MRKVLQSLLSFITFFAIVGCSTETITDTKSEQRPTLVINELESNMKMVDVYTDTMQRDGQFPKKVVVDITYYEKNQISRGDIVYLEIPKEEADELAHGNAGPHIARVIALPNETIKIDKGQIYINDRKLDTFYGYVYKWAGGSSAEKVTDLSMENLTVPQDSYLITGDNWWRSPVGNSIEKQKKPIPKQYIKGKVIGYFQEQ